MKQSKKFEISWSDETDDNELFGKESGSSKKEAGNDFSRLLEEERRTPFTPQTIRQGEKVSGTIVKLGDSNDVFVDLSL